MGVMGRSLTKNPWVVGQKIEHLTAIATSGRDESEQTSI